MLFRGFGAVTPVTLCREVLAVPLPRRPLFPGGFMPVTVSNEKLIQELIQLKKGGCALVASCQQ